jgi:DNA/RNA-binding domain of Phe-tRNA-synthetase-like protein
MLSFDPHPLLDAGVFLADYDAPLGEIASPASLTDLFRQGAAAPMQRSEDVRAAVRNLLRHGGYKPTGRGKPASEYLVRAAEEGTLGSINLAVDACNAVSLHSGLPISVVDLDLVETPLRVRIAPEDTSYVFNASGQEIRIDGLIALFDAQGACANAVKDSQRTKTHAGTRRTLSIVWGTNAFPGLAAKAARWYRELLEAAGARTRDVEGATSR